MPSRGNIKRSFVEIHLAVFLFGFPGLFGKWLPLSPPLIVFGRVLFASIILALILLLMKKSFRVRSSRDTMLLALCGLILAIHWSLFFKSVQVSSVAIGLLAYSSFPVFTAFLEPLVFKEKQEPRSFLFAAVSVFGAFLIIPRFDLSHTVLRGFLWGLGAGLTFALLSLLNRALAQRRPSLLVAFYQDTYAVLFLLPFVFVLDFQVTVRTIGLLSILGIFCTAGAHTLFINGMKNVKARTASIISSLEPAYGIVLAFLFLGEVPSLRTLAGGLVILGAALAVTLRTGRMR